MVVAFYLIAQMVGAGQLIKLLFGLDYPVAVAVVEGAAKAEAHAGPSEQNDNEQMIKLLRPWPRR